MTVLTKCDLVKEKEKIEKYINFFSIDNYEEPNHESTSLYEQIRKIYDNNDIVTLKPLNLKDEDSIRDLLLEADNTIQYGENLEPKDEFYEKAEAAMNEQ